MCSSDLATIENLTLHHQCVGFQIRALLDTYFLKHFPSVILREPIVALGVEAG